jgi:hypothetical protein
MTSKGLKPCNNYPVQLLSAKFLTEDKNPKEKMKFLKGGEIPKGGRYS